MQCGLFVYYATSYKSFKEIVFSPCSYLPWFEIYYKLLNTLADYLVKQQVSIGYL